MKSEVVVTLAANFDQTFRRRVANKKNERVDTLIFQKGEPVLVPSDLYASIKRDVGNALLVCNMDSKGRMRPDHDLTAAFKEYLEVGKITRSLRKAASEIAGAAKAFMAAVDDEEPEEGNDTSEGDEDGGDADEGTGDEDVTDESQSEDDPLLDESVPK